MLKKYFIMAIATGLALVACSEKFDEPGIQPAGSDNVHTLSVGIEAGTYTPAEGGTKASMEAVIRVNWTEGDKVSVVNATTEKILGGYLEAKASGTSVTFEGTVTGTIDNGDRLYYIYPKLNNTEETDFADAGYDQKLSGQKYDATKPNEVCFYGYAEDVAGTVTISKKIQFNLVTAYAHLNMSNLPAKGAPLTGIDISNVNEGFTWKLSSEKALSAEPYAGNNGISVTCTNYNITQAGNAVVHFALPASAASQQARVITVNKAYKNDGYTVKELEKASYHNQLYTSWESNVSVTTEASKTKVSISNGGSADVAEGVIPVADAFVANKETEIGIGGVGTITFDNTATNKIKNNAGSANVFFKVEDVTNDTDVQNKNIVYEVTMKTVDEKGVEVFADGKADGVATVVVPLGDNVVSVQSVKLLDAEGQPIEGGVVDGSITFDPSSRILTFKVVHFSKYAISYTKRTQPITAVAQIGERNYETLSSAVAAAQNGNTIILIKNVILEKPIETNKTFTLTLNADITPISEWQTNSNTTDALVIIRRGGNITINGTGKISSGNIANTYAAVKLTNKDEAETGAAAKLTVDGDVTLEGYYYGIVGNDSRQNTEITINGGTIKGTAANDNIGIYHPQAGSLTINGGIIEGSTGIALKGGKLVVNDGTIIGNGVSATFSHNGSGWNNTGDALAVEVCDYPGQNQTDLSAEIKGGKFASTNGKPVASYVQPDKSYTPLAGFISGGIYSKQPAAELIPFGYHIESNPDSQTSSAYPWRVAANPAANAEVSVSKPGQTTVYSTLADFRDETNAGNTFAGYTVTLLKDIDMAGINDWKAIGDDGNEYDNLDKNFSGIFDGNGKTISNLAISSPNYWGAALFGYVDGTVKNLTISNSSCSGNGGNAILAVMCGGNVTIENCHLIGCSVSTSSSSGLMISHVYNAETAVIKNCSTDANSSITSTGGYQIGGIIGQTTSINTLEITDCVNRASVTGIYGIGGIIGQFGNNITNATLTRCKNYGAIQLTTHTIQYAGGIAGVIPTTTSVNTNYKFVDCENHGTVTAAPEWPTFNSCTGGMIGYAYQNEYVSLSMKGCKNTAAVGSDRSIYSGAMIGWHHYAKGTDIFQFTECINSGAITATQNARDGNHNAGGAGQLVGCSDGSHDNATNCTLTGTASANGVTKITGEE